MERARKAADGNLGRCSERQFGVAGRLELCYPSSPLSVPAQSPPGHLLPALSKEVPGMTADEFFSFARKNQAEMVDLKLLMTYAFSLEASAAANAVTPSGTAHEQVYRGDDKCSVLQ